MAKRLLNKGGFALEATLIYIVLLTALIGLAVGSIVMVQRAGGVDYRGSRVTYATEAAADHVMAQLATDISDGIITDPELNSITAPVVPGFTFTQPTATRVNAAVPKQITRPPYTGLYSLNQQIDIRTTASDVSGNQSTAVVSVNAQSIPLFQFGVFYQGDLEIHNGPRMDFAGWVHTNSNLYLTSNNTYFQDNVTAADSVFWMRKASNERLNGVFINDASANPVALNFDSRSDPGASFVSKSNAAFNGRLMSSASGVTPLNLPLPAGLPPTAMVDEKSGLDDVSIQSVKFAWKADLHIVVDASKLDDANFCANAMVMDRGPRPKPSNAECALIFSGKSNAFHDGRENVGVDVVDIDVNQLELWVQAHLAPKPIDIVYLTFTNVTDALPYTLAQTLRDYPAVRLKNGQQLRYPLTIATDRPVYVQNSYNVVGWQPASILGDAVTYLSSNWSDANYVWNPAWVPDDLGTAHPFALNGAAPMQVYAAIAAGHSSTPCDANRLTPSCNPADSAARYGTPLTPGAVPPNYGGGLENFPRFLENWSGIQMLYRGSLVSLFESRYAMRKRWSWMTYYNPPARDWAFDTNFRDPTKLPPGTPTVGSVIQTAYRPIY